MEGRSSFGYDALDALGMNPTARTITETTKGPVTPFGCQPQFLTGTHCYHRARTCGRSESNIRTLVDEHRQIRIFHPVADPKSDRQAQNKKRRKNKQHNFARRRKTLKRCPQQGCNCREPKKDCGASEPKIGP